MAHDETTGDDAGVAALPTAIEQLRAQLAEQAARQDELIARQARETELLHLGAGDGRNSLFLAPRGFGVSACDVSPTAVARLKARAAREQLPIEAALYDLSLPGEFGGSYDLIVADTVLCHLDRAAAHALADKITAALRPGGWLYASVFAPDDPRESEFAPLVQTYFGTAAFCDRFPRLELGCCANSQVRDRRHGPAHRHSLLQLVARRPG